MANTNDPNSAIQSFACALGFAPLDPHLSDAEEQLLERTSRELEILHLCPVEEHHLIERRAGRLTKDESRAAWVALLRQLLREGRLATTTVGVERSVHDAHIARLEEIAASSAWQDLVAQRQSGAIDDRACLDAWYVLADAEDSPQKPNVPSSK